MDAEVLIDLGKLRQLTYDNFHTKARMMISESLGDESLYESYEILDKLHMNEGHLTNALSLIRRGLDSILFNELCRSW